VGARFVVVAAAEEAENVQWVSGWEAGSLLEAAVLRGFGG